MDRIPIVLKHVSYTMNIKWDSLAGKGVDLDLQAVIVDERGLIVDAVYYNNTSALGGAVALSGDGPGGETTGHGVPGPRADGWKWDCEGFAESLWINLSKLPGQVRLIIFVVAVYDEGTLRDVDNGQIMFSEEGRPLSILRLERSRGDADIVAMLRLRPDARWEFEALDAPAEVGSHFLDILEPNIGDLIRREIREAPRCQRVCFEMEKGALASLPQTSAIKRLFVGIGGSLPFHSKHDVDIDVAAVFFSTEGHVVGAVDCDCDELYGLQHSGDNVCRKERGEGDDEAISIDLAQVPAHVACIFLVLTVSEGHFGLIRHAYARIIDQTAAELVRYDIEGGRKETGLIIAQLLRANGHRWSFQAVGSYLPQRCRTWKGATAEMRRLFHESREPPAAPGSSGETPSRPLEPVLEEGAAAAAAAAAAPKPMPHSAGRRGSVARCVGLLTDPLEEAGLSVDRAVAGGNYARSASLRRPSVSTSRRSSIGALSAGGPEEMFSERIKKGTIRIHASASSGKLDAPPLDAASVGSDAASETCRDEVPVGLDDDEVDGQPPWPRKCGACAVVQQARWLGWCAPRQPAQKLAGKS